MTANAYCTACGAVRATGKAFCTECGAQHAVLSPDPPTTPQPRPTVQPRSLRCVECGSEIDSGLVCARCASRVAPPPSTPVVPKGASPQPTPATRSANPKNDPWSRFPWRRVKAFCLVGAVVGLLGLAADLKLFNPRAWIDRHDGRYVDSDGPLPLTIKVHGGTAFMDLGVLKVYTMKAEWHGSTLSLSGGDAYDAESHPIEGAARAAFTGGSDVDLLTVENDGQALSMDLGNGRKAVFVKQANDEG